MGERENAAQLKRSKSNEYLNTNKISFFILFFIT